MFLGATHAANERRTWAAISLTIFMMVAEIAGGALFGSLAVVADGVHMATHALALLIAAMAYTYARQHANDPRFVFGTGKLGDLAGYSSAIVLAMIALAIGYEAVVRLFMPVTIHFDVAILIAAGGLAVNIATAWLLGGGGDNHHGHERGHAFGHRPRNGAHAHDEPRRIDTAQGPLLLEVFEDGVPPRFRLRREDNRELAAMLGERVVTIETERAGGARQTFSFACRGGFLESVEEIPEPHEFKARLRLASADKGDHYAFDFVEHVPGGTIPATAASRDHNMRAAFVHVAADAAISVLAICGLLLGRYFGWVFMGPLMSIIGALVIANWAYALIRDTGGILLDMSPDMAMDVWRLGPGHLGAIISILTAKPRDVEFYRSRLGRFHMLSHLTIEVRGATAIGRAANGDPTAAGWLPRCLRALRQSASKVLNCPG
jgi:cation diffusion facilitator family transporter